MLPNQYSQLRYKSLNRSSLSIDRYKSSNRSSLSIDQVRKNIMIKEKFGEGQLGGDRMIRDQGKYIGD